MSKKSKGIFRLRVELLLAVGVSLLIAYGGFVLCVSLGNYFLDQKAFSVTYMYDKSMEMANQLRTYIQENELEVDDLDAIQEWSREAHTSVVLYDPETQSQYNYYSFIGNKVQVTPEEEDEFDYLAVGADAETTLTFTDGTTVRSLFYYDKIYKYYEVVSDIGLVLAFLLFLACFLLVINRKIRYLRQLAYELQILKQDHLSYTVTIQGRDEIAQLAEGINQLRLAVIEREEEERRNNQASRDLVTALSHDIRTPMTSLIGYLEILKMHRYQNEEQREVYLETARQKAFQLKEMTDRLFEYSLVTGKVEESYQLEEVEVNAILLGLLDGQISDLLNEGWEVEENLTGRISQNLLMVDIDFFHRVMDNLLSNIRKYADKSKKIVIHVDEKEGEFILSFRNMVLHAEPLGGSSGVGLKTCEKIMRAMNGSMRVEKTKNVYGIFLILPLGGVNHPGILQW